MNELSDYERSKVVESASNATFTFGDRNTVHSQKKITLPCRLGKLNVDITTDVVNCKIPLLLSNRSMRKARMCIDFGKDTAQIGNNLINLRTSSSSHYLLPITLWLYDSVSENVSLNLECKNVDKVAGKLHKQFGHPTEAKLLN